MALAILTHEDSEGGQHRFRFDIGRNRYFAYAIGPDEPEQRHGIPILADLSHVSPLQGPVPELEEGRGEFQVPAELFHRKNPSIQLVSYRDRDRRGPAYSNLVRVSPGISPTDESLPDITFTNPFQTVNDTRPQNGSPIGDPPRGCTRNSNIRLRRRPTMPAMSHAQDFGLSAIGSALLTALPTLLPMLIPAVMGAGSALLPAGTQILNNQAVQGSLNQIVNSVLQGAGAIPRTSAPPSATPTLPPAPVAAPVRASSIRPRQKHTAVAFGRRSGGYSQAMIAPALLAALPALMPLLQQVLSPQTIQGVLQTADPNRLIGTVTQAIGQLGQLGAQIDQQHMQHLERLNPGVDDPALMNLLQGLSTRFREASTSMRPARGVRLHLSDLTTIPLEGRSLPLLHLGRDWAFPLAIETPKSIPPSELRLTLKDAQTLKVVARHRLKTPPLHEGRLPVHNLLRADQLSSVKAGQDYLACFDLLWKSKSGERVGTHITQLFTAVGDFTFDAIEDSSELIPLNDIDRHRDFWHQVWSAQLSREINRAEMECTYNYLVHGDETQNAHISTTLKSMEKGLHRRQVRLESGMLLSLVRLNELLPQISAHPSLDEKELAALVTPGFLRQTHRAARTSVKLNGRPGQTAALWVFPEIKIQSILLQQSAETNEQGHVLRLTPHVVRFPLPGLAHFVGVRSR